MPGTTYDYFLRACNRSVETLAGTRGQRVSDENGNSAIFWLEMTGAGRVAAAHYRATTCTTLIAVCEHLSEFATGLDLHGLSSLAEEAVLALHSDIPAEKRGCVRLALKALRSAAENVRLDRTT